MRKKRASRSAFLNPRVLIGLAFFLAGVFMALAGFGPNQRDRQSTSQPASLQPGGTALAIFTATTPTPTPTPCNQVAFVSNRDGNDEIYVMNAAPGSIQTRLTNNPALDIEPSFSRDGSKIAFVSPRNGGNDAIYVMKVDGSNQTQLTSSSQSNGFPSFSGDGSKIAFASTRDGNFEIYVMNAA